MRKSKINSVFKRTVAAVISVSMLISLCVLPASAEEDYAWMLNFDGTDPAAGNPEGGVDPASTIFDSMDSEHGNVMKIPSTAGDVKVCGNVFARNTWESGDTLEARDYVFSFDFYAKQTNVGYMLQVHGSDGNYMTFDIDNDGTASFAKGGGWIEPIAGDESFHNKFTYGVNTWHTVDAAVTISEQKIDYYIDGQYLGTDIGNPAFGTGAFKFAGTFTSGAWVSGDVDAENQAVYFDNFNVRYKKDDSLLATIDNAVKTGDISAINTALKENYQKLGISEDMFADADTDMASSLLINKLASEKISLNNLSFKSAQKVIGTVYTLAASLGDCAWIMDFDNDNALLSKPTGWAGLASAEIIDSGDSAHNKVLKIAATAGEVEACGNIGAKNDWDSGTTLDAVDYTFSFDFYAKQSNVGYMVQIQGNAGAYMTFNICPDGTATFSKIGNAANGNWVEPICSDEAFHNKFNYTVNTWHTVDAVVSISEQKINYYIDGQYLGTDTGSELFGTGAFKNISTFRSGAWVSGNADPDNQAVYFDNFNVRYKDATTVFAAIDTAAKENNINEVEKILTANYKKFGISEDMFEKSDANQAASILADRITNGKTLLGSLSSDIAVKVIRKEIIISAASKGNIDNVFDYLSELELASDTNWEWYNKEFVTEKVKTDISSKLTGDYKTEKAFYNKLEEAYVLAVVKNSDTEANMRDVLDNFHDKIGISKFANIKIYKKLAGKAFDSYEELKTEFNRLERQYSSAVSSAWTLDFDGDDPAAGRPEGWIEPADKIFDTYDAEHGKVMKIPSTTEEIVACGNLISRNGGVAGNETLEAKDYIFSFDFYAKQTNVGYMIQVNGSDGNYMTFVIDNDGTASFAQGGGWVVPTVDDAGFHKKFNYSVNTWHTVYAAVSVANNRIDYYIDGEYLGTDVGNEEFGTGAFKFAGTFTSKEWIDGESDIENQAIYFDNFNVSYTDENSFFANTDVNGNNIEITFSEYPSEKIENLEMFSCADGQKITVSDIFYAGKTLKFTVEGMNPNTQYAVALPDNFKSVSGNMLKDKFIYLYAAENVNRVESVKITDVKDVMYGPLEEIPVLIKKIEITVSEPITENAENILKSVAFTDSKGDKCDLINPVINDSKLTLDIKDTLNLSESYMITISDLSGINYEALFKTNSGIVDEIKFVSINGEEIYDIAQVQGAEVYAPVKFINNSDEMIKAKIILASYKNSAMISCVLNELSIVPMSIESDVLGISVPEECDEIKAFIWKDAMTPMMPVATLSYTSKIKSEMNIPKLGNAYFGNNVELGVTLKEENNRSFEGKLRLTLEAENGECVISEKDIGLNGREEKNVNFNITVPQYGYYSVTSECISANGGIKDTVTERISVISPAENANSKVGFSDHTTKNYGFSADKLKMAANAGVGTIRDEIRWTEFETTEGIYAPDKYTEGWLNFTEETKQNRLAILGYWFPGRTQTGIPRIAKDVEAFKNYVTEVLKYTKDMDIDYELWNEHNVHMGDDYGSIEDYVNIAKIIYPLKEEINPDAKIYVLATGNTDNVKEYVEECFKLGIGDYCDGISIHPYNVTLAPEHMKFSNDINAIKNLMEKYNLTDKELIISELGWTTSEEYKWADEDTQANYTIRAMALYQDMVDRIYWYNLQEKTVSDMTDLEIHFGFLRGWADCEIPYEPKPAFLALSNYNRLMTNSQKIKKMEHSNENAEVHLFNNNKGTNTIIAWSKASEVKTAINIGAASVVISDRYGNEKSVDTKNGILELSLTVEPIYITGSFSDEISEYEVQ